MPTTTRQRAGKRAVLLVGAMLLHLGIIVPLIAAGALAAVGSTSGHPWVLKSVLLLVLAAVAWFVQRYVKRRKQLTKDAHHRPAPPEEH
jgi:uncharacterized membrane protein